MSSVPPPDEHAHRDRVLMGMAAEVNVRLGRYVLSLLDADALRAPELPVAEERALADRVAELAEGLRERAARREVVINGVATDRHLGTPTNRPEGEEQA